MEPATGKHSSLRNFLKQLRFLALFIFFCLRHHRHRHVLHRHQLLFLFACWKLSISSLEFSPVLTLVSGGSVVPENQTRKEWINYVSFYTSVFRELVSDRYLSTASKSLCMEMPIGHGVLALKEIGVVDAVGISKKALKAPVKERH